LSKEIKIGLIGSGFVGQVAHLHCFNNLKNSKIIALSELRPRLGEKVCKKYNIPSLYSDYKEMIKENNLDLIIAIVKRYHTAKVAHDVLNRNINLFTEKPMAPTLLQAKKLLKISKKKKLKYVVGNMRRFDHGVQILKKYLKQNLPTGELGHIVNFRCYCIAGNDYCNIDGNITTKEPSKTKSEWPRYPEWIKFPKEGKKFETFLNYFSHDINLIRYFFGDYFINKNINIKDKSGSITFEYKNFYGDFEFIYSNQKIWREGMEINFDKGQILLELPPAFLRNQPSKITILKDFGNKKSISPVVECSWSFKNQAIDLIKHISGNHKSISSANDTIKDLITIENIWKKII